MSLIIFVIWGIILSRPHLRFDADSPLQNVLAGNSTLINDSDDSRKSKKKNAKRKKQRKERQSLNFSTSNWSEIGHFVEALLLPPQHKIWPDLSVPPPLKNREYIQIHRIKGK